MKRVSILIIAFILFSFPAFAEIENISDMTFEDLSALKYEVDLEFYSRPESEPFVLYPGRYIVGEDIRPGYYYISVLEYTFNVVCSGHYIVYQDSESTKSIYGGYQSITDKSTRITLQEENVLLIYDYPISFGIRPFEEDPKYQIPNGTYIPIGTYTVGNEIPAGRYEIYMGTLDGISVTLYEDDLAYKERNKIEYLDALPIWSHHTCPIKLEDGNVVKVQKDCVFVKQASFSFE